MSSGVGKIRECDIAFRVEATSLSIHRKALNLLKSTLPFECCPSKRWVQSVHICHFPSSIIITMICRLIETSDSLIEKVISYWDPNSNDYVVRVVSFTSSNRHFIANRLRIKCAWNWSGCIDDFCSRFGFLSMRRTKDSCDHDGGRYRNRISTHKVFGFMNAE